MAKKFLTILLTAAMILSFAGCGAQNTQQENKAPDQTAEEPLTEEPQPEAQPMEETEETEETSGAFETMELTDLEGNEVDKSIFEDYDLTMINIWATSCNPCLKEMPELAKISDEYEEDDGNVQIVGMCADLVDMEANRVDSQIELVNQIVELTGADYIQLVPDADMLQYLMENVRGVPTTYFVDSEGKIVGEPTLGARNQEKWQKEIDDRLAILEK